MQARNGKDARPARLLGDDGRGLDDLAVLLKGNNDEAKEPKR